MEKEEEEKSFTQRLYQQVEEYARVTVELYKLKAIQTFADLFAAVATGFIIWVIVFMFLLFISFGAAFYFGEILGGWYYGFFIVAGFYVLVGFILYLLRFKYLKASINDFIIRQIFKED